MGIFLSIFLFALWSSVFPIGKWMVAFSTPVFLTGIRMLFAGVILTGYLLIRKKSSLKLSPKQWLSIIILAVLSIYLTNVLEFYGLKHLSAAKTCFIYSLSPFFAALFSFLHFNERMTKTKWIGLLIGFAGMIPVLMVGGEGNIKSIFDIVGLPELAVMGAALFSVYGWVLLRMCVKGDEVSPGAANGLSMLIGGAIALVHSFIFDGSSALPSAPGGTTAIIQGTLVMTLISNIICYNLYGYLLKRYTATLLSFFGLLSPIFASITSWFFIQEAPSPIILLSTAIVGIGLYTVYRAESKLGYID